MKAASAMLEIAGDLSWIYRETFENKTKSCIALTAIAYAKTQYEGDGSVAYLQLESQDYANAGATDEDSEGFSAMLRAIQGVHVSIFVRDGRNPGQYRISLRSDEACDVAKVAGEFGGGGHARAAGITYTPDKEETFTQFKNRLITRLKECIEA
jgi:phosphoesterase RecJ-like protein